MRASLRLLRTPLIRFLGKRVEPKSIDHTPKVHPQSPSNTLPVSFAQYRQTATTYGPLGGKGKQSVEPIKGEYFSIAELPARFHDASFSELEIDAINSGGADVVFS